MITAQLQAIVEEFEDARRRLGRLAADVPEAMWSERPDPDRWSVGECIAHLNLTSKAFVPILRDAIARGRALGGSPPARYRRDVTGWLLWLWSGPPARLRTRTSAPFVPGGRELPAELISEFGRLQDEQIACVREADGLPLGRIKIRSPFDTRVSYNLFSALSILPRHQHRHLWQAEQVRAAIRRA